jgi:hypothetical protein
VDGSKGRMTRADILLHLADHGTYHRGFVITLLYPYKTKIAVSDLTEILRYVWPEIVAGSKGKMSRNELCGLVLDGLSRFQA